MGTNGSKLVKKIVSPFNANSNSGKCTECDSFQVATNCTVNKGSGPIVLSRQGSMFFDEDGDLAHEFYIEELPLKKGMKAKMKRIKTNLTPQGDVQYQCPRLHNDYPLILYQI